MNHPSFSLVLTGEWPGAGQSTTATIFAQKFGFERVYAGFLFRKFAFLWQQYQNQLTWDQFENQVVKGEIKVDDCTFKESDFNEGILHQFQHQLKSVDTPDTWDKIIDRQSLLALQKPGVVVEAKVGVLLDKIGMGDFNQLTHRVYKILLVCPPEISAHRVIKRKIENGELPPLDTESETYLELVRQTTTDTINRHLRDWERYEKIYGIKRSDIYRQDIDQVYTTNKEPQEVVNAIAQLIQTHP